MTERICGILRENSPSVYLYGSVTLGDFRLGWSDIDMVVLTQSRLSESQAERLVDLRQKLLEEEPQNPYFRLFEGGMLTLDAFLNGEKDRVVYWGTSGQRVTDTYRFDSFSMTELIENGVLLAGQDVRGQLKRPAFDALYSDVAQHYETIRKYVRQTDRSLYSYGWLLDISRCIYTLRTGKIIAKTAAGEWALKEGICPAEKSLKKAIEIRYNAETLKNDHGILDFAETLGGDVQAYADVLEKELRAARHDG